MKVWKIIGAIIWTPQLELLSEMLSRGDHCSSQSAGPHLNLLAGWRAAPSALLAAWGARYAARGGMAFALLLGLLANFTVIGSVAPSGIVPLSFCMARSASTLWSKRMKPTPLERPGTEPSLEPPAKRTLRSRHNTANFKYPESYLKGKQTKSVDGCLAKLFLITFTQTQECDFLDLQHVCPHPHRRCYHTGSCWWWCSRRRRTAAPGRAGSCVWGGRTRRGWRPW